MDRIRRNSQDPDDVRMSIGDHLDSLRSHMIRGLLGVVLGSVIGLALGDTILEIVCRPVVSILSAHHMDPHLQVLNPQEPFVIWIRVGLFTGLILGGPYLLWEVWRFVALGLYTRERKLVRRMIPASMLLFVCGVLFFFFLVLPVALNFFVSFAGRLTAPTVEPNWLERIVVGVEAVEPVTTQPSGPSMSVLPGSPESPPLGTPWIDTMARELRIATEDGIYGVRLTRIGDHQMVQSQFRLREYISFVGMLALGFGVAFQTPVVVVFLSWSGLFRTSQMAAARKYVLFGISIGAAVLTPTPDALSMLLLAVPMFLLFEGGLIVARVFEGKQSASASD